MTALSSAPLPLARRRLRVLVVDDDSGLRECTAELLREDGYAVRTAVDGRAALDELAADQWDLILTDFDMPKMNGAQLARITKRICPEMPVLMISAVEQRQLEKVDVFLAKPFLFEEIRAAIRKCFLPASARRAIHPWHPPSKPLCARAAA